MRPFSTVDAPEHYRKLLAKHYVWMCGVSIEAKVSQQVIFIGDLLSREGIDVDGSAIDLGCGPGFQALALAQLGFRPVFAVDNNEALLSELHERGPNARLSPCIADLRVPSSIGVPERAHVITCMGDTLTHLETKEQVTELLSWSFDHMVPGGLLAITYRDLSSSPVGSDRFILVRADQTRILTCVLEFDEPESVVINDLVHELHPEGTWKLESSSYRKLVIAVDWLSSALVKTGFEAVKIETLERQQLVTARRPANF